MYIPCHQSIRMSKSKSTLCMGHHILLTPKPMPEKSPTSEKWYLYGALILIKSCQLSFVYEPP